MSDDERTIMQDAQDQLRTYHVGELAQKTPRSIQRIREAFAVPKLTQEEQRALEVAQCARHAVMDTAAMCARAGLIGTAIQEDLEAAHAAMVRVIDTIQGKN